MTTVIEILEGQRFQQATHAKLQAAVSNLSALVALSLFISSAIVWSALFSGA